MAIMDNLNGNIEALKRNLSSPYNFKGSTTFAALPASGNNVNDTYYCTDKKCNYTWNGSAWNQSSIGEAEYQAQLTQLEENFNGEIGNLSSEIANITDSYDNLVGEMKTTRTINIANGSAESFLDSEPVAVEKGKDYFILAKFKVTDLSSWNSGLVYLRASYDVLLSGWNDVYISNIENNGEYAIFYNFKANQSGNVRVQLYFNQQSPSTNTFTVIPQKVYFVETSEDISSIVLANEDNGDIVLPHVKNGSIGYEKLSDDLKKCLPVDNSTIIDMWGDSLMKGIGGSNYSVPLKLQELVGNNFTVNNLAHGGETGTAIAFRQGAFGVLIEHCTLKAGAYTKVKFKSVTNTTLQTLFSNNEGTEGINNVVINGSKYMFRTTDNANEANIYNGKSADVVLNYPTLAFAEGCGTKHIMVVGMGQNGTHYGSYDVEELIRLYNLMVKHNNSDKYLIVGIPTHDAEFWNDLETKLGNEFGNKFVNVREYISGYGLSDNGLTPTEADISAMESGAIPPQLLSNDGVHLNDYGYIAMANCIYLRGKALEYWS